MKSKIFKFEFKLFKLFFFFISIPLVVPPFISKSIQKILAGDDAIISLFSTPPSHLFDSFGNPPKAVKAQFFTYQFTNISHLFSTGEYWEAKVDFQKKIIFNF
jgi:hypothetical protein